ENNADRSPPHSSPIPSRQLYGSDELPRFGSNNSCAALVNSQTVWVVLPCLESYSLVGEKPMTARMKDVAAYAGVSIATVSYVVNNKPQKTISDETAIRVLDAARALDYKINEDAQRLAQQRIRRE